MKQVWTEESQDYAANQDYWDFVLGQAFWAVAIAKAAFLGSGFDLSLGFGGKAKSLICGARQLALRLSLGTLFDVVLGAWGTGAGLRWSADVGAAFSAAAVSSAAFNVAS
jgi:hypothetical protein